MRTNLWRQYHRWKSSSPSICLLSFFLYLWSLSLTSSWYAYVRRECSDRFFPANLSWRRLKFIKETIYHFQANSSYLITLRESLKWTNIKVAITAIRSFPLEINYFKFKYIISTIYRKEFSTLYLTSHKTFSPSDFNSTDENIWVSMMLFWNQQISRGLNTSRTFYQLSVYVEASFTLRITRSWNILQIFNTFAWFIASSRS